MAVGPGKYDPETTMVREATQAAGVILMVFGGDRGDGFSCQIWTPTLLKEVPAVLRSMADQIEEDGNKLLPPTT